MLHDIYPQVNFVIAAPLLAMKTNLKEVSLKGELASFVEVYSRLQQSLPKTFLKI